jgi:phosphoesterase RecJ-like protein
MIDGGQKMKNIIDRIKEANYIILSTHINPDADGIGAGLALMRALQKMGKKVDFITQDKAPRNLSILKGIEEIKEISEVGEGYDLAITVDSATLDRIGDVKSLMTGLELVNIDHHISNPAYGTYNLIKNISSTCEIMYDFIKELGAELDLEMGEALYAGVVNDTGNFSHDNVTKHTFDIAGELIELGVNNSKIVREVFHNKSFVALKVLGDAFSEMKFIPEKRFVYYYLPYEKLIELGATKEDTEGVVERINSLEESNVSLFLRGEKDGSIKGSMRSKEDIDVNSIASVFGGGGHKKAAGFSSKLSAQEIIKMVEERL